MQAKRRVSRLCGTSVLAIRERSERSDLKCGCEIALWRGNYRDVAQCANGVGAARRAHGKVHVLAYLFTYVFTLTWHRLKARLRANGGRTLCIQSVCFMISVAYSDVAVGSL
eukprot:6200962-Pleurochrysis_carterae.AAC.1